MCVIHQLLNHRVLIVGTGGDERRLTAGPLHGQVRKGGQQRVQRRCPPEARWDEDFESKNEIWYERLQFYCHINIVRMQMRVEGDGSGRASGLF